MRPELQRLVDELTEVRTAIAQVQDTEKLATNGWTVAGILDHLVKVHEALIPRFQDALNAAPDLKDVETVVYSPFERRFVRVLSGKSFKVPVPSIFKPDPTSPNAKEACLASIDALLVVLRQADEKALSGLRIKPPITNLVSIGLMPYLDGVVQHARYHQSQI